MKTIEIISGDKKAQFTTKSVTLDGKEFFYSRMTSVACDTESHCYKFTYEGKTVLLPYEPKDSKILNAIFKQVQNIEEKRRFTQALAAADAERLRAAALAQESQKSAPVQTERPADTPDEPEESPAPSKKLSIAEIMEGPAEPEKNDVPAEETQEAAETKAEEAPAKTAENSEPAAEEKKPETKAERKARKQAEKQARKEAKAKAKAEAKAAKEAAKAPKSDDASAAEAAEIKAEEAPAETEKTEASNITENEEKSEAVEKPEASETEKSADEATEDKTAEESKTAEEAKEKKSKDKPKKEKTPMDPEKKASLKKSLTRFGIIVAVIVVLSVVYYFVFGTNNQPTQVAPNSTESQQYDDIDQLIDDLQ